MLDVIDLSNLSHSRATGSYSASRHRATTDGGTIQHKPTSGVYPGGGRRVNAAAVAPSPA